jgi:hypothetical protein
VPVIQTLEVSEEKSPVSLEPTRRTTRSMIKQMKIPTLPTLQEEPIDIPASPEVGDETIQEINAAKELVAETLKELSFGCKDKKKVKKWEDPLVL